jgi:hypothetical protein
LAVTKQADKWAIEYIKSLLPDLLILGTEPNGMSLMLIPVAMREVGECHSDIGDCQITDSLIDGPIKVLAAYQSSGEVCAFSSKYDASKYGVPS